MVEEKEDESKAPTPLFACGLVNVNRTQIWSEKSKWEGQRKHCKELREVRLCTKAKVCDYRFGWDERGEAENDRYRRVGLLPCGLPETLDGYSDIDKGIVVLVCELIQDFGICRPIMQEVCPRRKKWGELK